MKKVILILCGVLFTGPMSSAFAGSWNSSFQNVSCRAYDSGWEEHWGGHSSCDSCKSKHGSCTEICEQTYYTCTVTATEGSEDRKREFEFSFSDTSEWSARQGAEDRCWRSSFTSCSMASCTSEREQVSRNSCR